MTDLDALLARLRDEPPPQALAAIDGTVLDELARLRAMPVIGASALSLAAALAMAFGVFSTVVRGQSAAAAPLSPLGGASALAPSSLLDVR